MLSEVNAAFESGRITGQIFVWVALFGGCLEMLINLTSAGDQYEMCPLADDRMSGMYSCWGGFGTLTREFGTSPAVAFAGGILGLGMLAGLVAAIVLAVLGLVECSKQRDLYTQGQAQAIWTLALAGVMCLIAGTGFIKGFPA